MLKSGYVFTKEIAELLVKLRKQAGFTQTEVASELGLSGKTGKTYISRLEKGRIKNPSLETILAYLDAVGVNWGTFFTELSNLRTKQEHETIMSSVKLPADEKLQKKLDRDTFLYETKIKPPQNYYTKVDLDLVKQKIEEKVRTFCQNLRIKDELIPHYLNFANEILTATKYTPIIEKYYTSGISRPYLTEIMNIVIKTHHAEEKSPKTKTIATTKSTSNGGKICAGTGKN